ncbi:MAG: translation initiation factor IF-2 subunit alpha [Thermoprotei archaeon]|nr:MAG: translation initiation factor IF-2 subunit alpha [Thermoprotei archaeon]RLF19196.1 MAG: translation initiation factor IF-2 subunit alpha [Thermoprotei archaeon]
MVRKREKWPKVGELVIGTVIRIFEQGAYVTLDEYEDKLAYVPAVEITRSWFRSIKEYLREGQKAVFKVMRVVPSRNQIDLSLKRVSERERKEKIYLWKRAQRAEKLLEMAAKKLGKTLDDAYKEAGWPMEDYFGEIFAGFEEAAIKGEKVLLECGLSPEWAKVITEIAKTHIEIPKVKLNGIVTLTCLSAKGIIAIKEALLKAAEYLKSQKDIKWRIYTVGAPRYRIEIITSNPKEGEKILREAANIAINVIKKYGGFGSFTREERK